MLILIIMIKLFDDAGIAVNFSDAHDNDEEWC